MKSTATTLNKGKKKLKKTLVIYSDEDKESMKKWLVPLGQKYNQDSVLIVVDKIGYLVGAVGDDNLKPYEEVNIGNFTASKAGEIYSQRGKDTFVFESLLPDSMSGAYLRKTFSDKYVNENDSYETVLEKLVTRIKKARTIMEEFATDGIAALADYFEADPDEVVEKNYDVWGLPVYEVDDEEYAVADSHEEAIDAAEKDIKELIDELGFEAFNWDNMGGLNLYLETEWFEQARDGSNKFYAQDIHDSEYDRFVKELEDLGLKKDDPNYELDNPDGDHPIAIADFAKAMRKTQEDDPIEWYIDNFGKEDLDTLVKEGKVSIDLNRAADAVISIDGVGPVIASYDGEEIEHDFEGNTYYFYRVG